MKRFVVVVVCAVSFAAFAQDKAKPAAPMAAPAKTAAPAAAPAPAMAEAGPKMSCGQMMEAKSALPAKMSEMLTSVADGLEMHAKWASSTKPGKAEHDTLMKLSKDHRQMAASMKKTSEEMVKAKTLASVQHDMTKMDPKMGEVMGKQIALEREMASMMMKDADESEKMMQAMAKNPSGM